MNEQWSKDERGMNEWSRAQVLGSYYAAITHPLGSYYAAIKELLGNYQGTWKESRIYYSLCLQSPPLNTLNTRLQVKEGMKAAI